MSTPAPTPKTSHDNHLSNQHSVPPRLAIAGATSRAVVYLRVSSAGQVHTDRDADPHAKGRPQT